MTIIVVFKKDDVLGFSSFEDKVGASTSNRDNGPEHLDLIWKRLPLARVKAIVEAAYANRGVLAVIMKPTVETLRLTT